MKTKFNGIFMLLLALVVQISFAQEKTVSDTEGTAGRSSFFVESRMGVIAATKDFLAYDGTAEALFKDDFSQEIKAGVNDGSDKVTYNFVGSLYADDSFNLLNEQIRRNLSFGLNAQVSDKLKYQGFFSYVNTYSNLDYNANTSFGRFSAFEGGGRGNLNELTDQQWKTELDRFNQIGNAVDIANRVNRFTNSNRFFVYDVDDNFQINFTVGIDYRGLLQEEVQSNELQIALGSIADGTTNQAIGNRLIRNASAVSSGLNLTHNARFENLEVKQKLAPLEEKSQLFICSRVYRYIELEEVLEIATLVNKKEKLGYKDMDLLLSDYSDTIMCSNRNSIKMRKTTSLFKFAIDVGNYGFIEELIHYKTDDGCNPNMDFSKTDTLEDGTEETLIDFIDKLIYKAQNGIRSGRQTEEALKSLKGQIEECIQSKGR